MGGVEYPRQLALLEILMGGCKMLSQSCLCVECLVGTLITVPLPPVGIHFMTEPFVSQSEKITSAVFKRANIGLEIREHMPPETQVRHFGLNKLDSLGRDEAIITSIQNKCL